ncbi:MAG: type II toxin-antitoxin system Phd/YefM family antitoxin [Bulleidia sp.]|nr:type II toxin-antitoxin system Phd/YefM family antitoxin [Bulleidia sp.]
MIIKASSALRNEFPEIAKLSRETMEPIYITVHGDGEGVYMNLEAFEKREQMLNLRARVLMAEEQRLSGAETTSTAEARERLRKRVNDNI